MVFFPESILVNTRRTKELCHLRQRNLLFLRVREPEPQFVEILFDYAGQSMRDPGNQSSSLVRNQDIKVLRDHFGDLSQITYWIGREGLV